MRRFTAGLTLLAALGTLLALPLGSTGQPPNLADQLKTGVKKTLGGVNDVAARLREQERRRREREAALRRQRQGQGTAAPRQASPDPSGRGYVPPLHGNNPHGQGTPATTDLPASTLRPMPANPAGGNGEIVVAGRSRGEQRPDGSYHGHISIAALNGQDIVGVDTAPGQTRRGPLDAIQTGLLTPLCVNTQQGICLNVLTADSSTTATGSTNHFEATGAQVGGPTGIRASAARSNGNISQDANCQMAHGDSHVANAAVGTFTADAIESTSDSRECKDGTQTQTNTSRVLNLGQAGVPIPAAGCANGTPNTPALIPVLLPAICNANESNAAQAAAPYGVREGLTTFVAAAGTTALLKATTAGSESRAVRKAQCSDGIDNDGDGRIDFPNDPDCTGPTDDSEAGAARRTRPDDGGDEAECEDGIDNDGDGRVDYPDDRGCTSRNDDSEENDGAGTAGAGGGGAGGADGAGRGGGGGDRLAFTGTNLVLMLLIGSLVLLAGLRIRALTGRRGASRAQRAGMA